MVEEIDEELIDSQNYMGWTQYAMGLGFNKVTIINNANWQPVGYSDTTHIATAWTDPEGTMINENQELLNDWTDTSRAAFYFYGAKHNIILRDPDGNGKWILGQAGKTAIFACKLKRVYFICSGPVKGKGAKSADGEAGFPGAPGALDAILKNCIQPIIDKEDEEE